MGGSFASQGTRAAWQEYVFEALVVIALVGWLAKHALHQLRLTSKSTEFLFILYQKSYKKVQKHEFKFLSVFRVFF